MSEIKSEYTTKPAYVQQDVPEQVEFYRRANITPRDLATLQIENARLRVELETARAVIKTLSKGEDHV